MPEILRRGRDQTEFVFNSQIEKFNIEKNGKVVEVGKLKRCHSAFSGILLYYQFMCIEIILSYNCLDFILCHFWELIRSTALQLELHLQICGYLILTNSNKIEKKVRKAKILKIRCRQRIFRIIYLFYFSNFFHFLLTKCW